MLNCYLAVNCPKPTPSPHFGTFPEGVDHCSRGSNPQPPVNFYPWRNCKLHRNRWVSLILLRFARPQCLAATYSSSPEVGNGLSLPKPQCTCNAMATSQAQHSTNEGVLLNKGPAMSIFLVFNLHQEFLV